MKICFSLIVVALSVVVTLKGQSPGIDQSLEFTTLPTGEHLLHWYGLSGRSYFIQASETEFPLAKWKWCPLIESGNNEPISHEVGGTAEKGFFRLKYTNQLPAANETLDTADFDRDGISNIDEIDPPGPFGQTDPLNDDTDGDGLPDFWEIAHSLDPRDNGSADPRNGAEGMFHNSGISNAAAYQQGVQANANATPNNKDGDSLDDDRDAAPTEVLLDWEKTPESRYFKLDVEGVPTNYQVVDMNDKGQVLFWNTATSSSINSDDFLENPVGAVWTPGKAPEDSWKQIFLRPEPFTMRGRKGTGNEIVTVTTISPVESDFTTDEPAHGTKHELSYIHLKALADDGSVLASARYYYFNLPLNENGASDYNNTTSVWSENTFLWTGHAEGDYLKCKVLGDETILGTVTDYSDQYDKFWAVHFPAGFYNKVVDDTSKTFAVTEYQPRRGDGDSPSPVKMRVFDISEPDQAAYTVDGGVKRGAVRQPPFIPQPTPSGRHLLRGDIQSKDSRVVSEHETKPIELESTQDASFTGSLSGPFFLPEMLMELPGGTHANSWAVGSKDSLHVTLASRNGKTKTLQPLAGMDSRGNAIGTEQHAKQVWRNEHWTDLADLVPPDSIPEDAVTRKITASGLILLGDDNAPDVTLVLLPVEFSVYPVAEDSDDTVKISADDAEQELAAVILVPDMSQGAQSGSLIEAEDGTVIEWELTEGNGTISTEQSTTTDGVAVTTLTTSTTPGDSYKIEAKVTTLKWNGESFDLGDTGLVTESDLLEVVPGKAATIEAIKSKVEYSSDATDEVEIEITVKDQHENLLADGTPLTWILDKSTGGFAKNHEGEEEIESELINGKAKVSLRAPSMPVDQNLIVIVDGLTEEIPMTVNRVTGSISSSAASLDVHTGGNATITVSATAADETPVYWFTSNGSITPEAGSLSSGQATATLSTTGGRIEKTVVTATVGDRMFIWEGNFTSSAPVQVSFENPFLIGGVQPGGEPPQNGNGDDYEGPWFILTKGMIRAPAFGGYPATVTVPNGGALVQVTGLDGNSQIMLDQNGYAEFQVASVGTPNQFGRINIQVQVNPPGAAYVEIVETTPWTHVGDFFGGLIGLDTSTGTGVVTSIVGGYIIVGDVGAIVKNSVRNAGWSDKEPNNFELAMAGAGILGTFSGPGDGIVSAVRVIIQRIGNSPLADVLWRIAKRIITEGKLPSAAEDAFITMMKNDEVFSQSARHVLTDDKLFSQAARGLDKLGDPFANAVKHAANTNGIGSKTSQKIVDTVGNLSDDVLDGLKNSVKLDDALSGITKLVDASLIDPAVLAKTLENAAAFSGAYKQADLLVDAKKILDSTPQANGFDRLFKELRNAQNYESAKGYLFELSAARKLADSGEAVLDVSTKGLNATDLRSSTHLIQAKFSAGTLAAFVRKKGRGVFVEGKRKAEELGLGYKIVISEGSVEADLLQWLSAKGISIQTLPFP